MKPIRFILLLISFAAATAAFAQAPQRFNYQAVARDGSDNPISNKAIAVQISILDGASAGSSIYTEQFTPTTGSQGLFSVQIGGGNSTSGAFNTIVWGNSSKFLKVEIDPAGGTAFTTLGTSQLVSVPYALTADRLSTPMAMADLADVSDTQPQVDQVLKWDGTSWVPGSGSGSSIVTAATLSGDGTEASPLTIAPQGATSGQVLQWNGTDWLPATISGGVGDNWGTQVANVNATLTGSGTAASPLGIASNGASNGDVLKWSGTQWLPAPDAGDNWGTAKVNTSSQFSGDGTPVAPLVLAQQGAATGQFLTWSGTGWIPGDDGGSLTLPAALNSNDAGTSFLITNTVGTPIQGTVVGNSPTVYGVRGNVANSTGAGTAGVFGSHGSTAANGYGVMGTHAGNGVAVNGEASGATGTGVQGKGLGGNGIGVAGSGTTGVSGTSATANGTGVYGNSTNGGYAGKFDEKVIISSNSSSSIPTLQLNETENTDKVRLKFYNNNGSKYWETGARNMTTDDLDKYVVTHYSKGDILTVSGDARVGIKISNPSAELDVNGNVKIWGNIIANSVAGANGQVLSSTGSQVVWSSGTTAAYNGTILQNQNATATDISSEIAPDNLNNMSFTTTGASKVSFNFSHSQIVSNGTGGDVDLEVELGFKDVATGNVINNVLCADYIVSGRKKTFSYTHHCQFGSAGTFKPYVVVRTKNGGHFNLPGGGSNGQVTIVIVQQ